MLIRRDVRRDLLRGGGVLDRRNLLLRCMSPLLALNGHLNAPGDVRFRGDSGLRANLQECPLMTLSEHGS